MNYLSTTSVSELPLSWARTNTDEPVFNKVELPFSSPVWIPTAEIPHHYSFDMLYRDYLSGSPHGFVLQSCNKQLRDFLIQEGWQAAPMGAEAVLDLPWRGKRSVRELARRGRRHGTVREIEVSGKHQQKLIHLMNDSASRKAVQLKHTERAGFDDNTRCFVFKTPENKWLGAITLSTLSPNKVHTELLLRHRDAPIGIMEAIITALTNQLALEGVKHLSLGAVTPPPAPESETILSVHRHPKELWSHSQVAFRLGRALKIAYNSEGLWRFKNKFSPRWEPLYICASPAISWATIFGIVRATGYLELLRHQLMGLWRPHFPVRKPQVPSRPRPVWPCAVVKQPRSPLSTG